MNNFGERLGELMEENNIDAKDIVPVLKLANPSAVYKWRNNRKSIMLPNAIKLADLFQCSLDYLVGRSDFYGSGPYRADLPPFGEQLKKVLKEMNSSQNKLIKFANVSGNSLNKWVHNRGIAHVESAISIADYLNISMDYLVGRD